MNRRFLAISVCALLCLGSADIAYSQRAARRAGARRQPPVALDGDLARHFPADTFLYLEVSNLAALAEQLGGGEYLYALLRASFPSEMARAGKPLFTAAQFQGLLGSRVGIGVVPPAAKPGAKAPKSEPDVVLLVQTPTREVGDLVLQFVAEAAVRQRSGSARPRVQSIRGVRVTSTVSAPAGRAFAYASVGSSVLFGDPALVTSVLARGTTPSAKRLADEPAFVNAMSRAAADRQLFAFLNGKSLVKAFNDGLATGVGSPGAPRAKAAEVAALRRFLGVDAILGGSATAHADAATMDVQAALELDRSRGGLVSILTDPPVLPMRSLAMVPSGTDMHAAASLDLVRIFDLILETFTPEVARSAGMPSPPELVALAEQQLGMRLRDDFLAAFGNEFAFGLRIKRGAETVTAEGAAKESVASVFLVEARNAEVISRGVGNLTRPASAPEGENTMSAAPELYEGFEILGTGSFRWAVVGGFAVIGERDEVVAVIDAHRSGESLATSPAFAAAAGTLPENAITASYMSPRFFEWSARSATGSGSATPSEPQFPNGLFVAVQKDASGVFSSFRFPIPNLRVLLEERSKKGAAAPAAQR